MSASDSRLSPPWYTVWNKILHTIGADPRNHVQPLQDLGGGKYLVRIITVTPVPGALATIVRPSYALGNVTVSVEILDIAGHTVKPEMPTGTDPAGAVLLALQTSLKNNPLYAEAFRPQKSPISPPTLGDVVLILQKAVVQFFNDDLTDYYSNFNGVAASVFAEVLNTQYAGNVRLSFGTATTRP